MILEISKDTDPFDLFHLWFEAAKAAGVTEPNAMTLASASLAGGVFARVVLLKQYDSKGFCFFTNYGSQKATQILENPQAGLCFHWRKPEHRQIRIRGRVEKMTYEESDTYFQSRPRGSRIGAWASPQSQAIPTREALDLRFKIVEDRFEGQEIPCPPDWGGFRVIPSSIEFWQEQEFRRHDRFEFLRDKKNPSKPWAMERLAP